MTCPMCCGGPVDVLTVGCFQVPLPNTFVEIYLVVGGVEVIIDSGTSDENGRWLAHIPEDGTYRVRLTAESPRFAVTINPSVPLRGETSIIQGCRTAVDYFCFGVGAGGLGGFGQGGPCALPIYKTLTWSDGVYGSRTLTHVPNVFGGWFDESDEMVPACSDFSGVFPSRSSRIQFSLASNVQPNVTWRVQTGGSFCPVALPNPGNYSASGFDNRQLDRIISCAPSFVYQKIEGPNPVYLSPTLVTITE